MNLKYSDKVGLDTKVSVVVVTYNSTGVLDSCLDSIPRCFPTIIVDNASDDVELAARIAGEHGAQLLRNFENAGFGKACNQGAAATNSEYILFLNPDTRLAPRALENLVAAGDRYRDHSGFSPRIVGANGKDMLKRHSVILPRGIFDALKPPTQRLQIPFLSGAAMFVRQVDFKSIGGFDTAIFLYHEDDDLSLRLLRERGPLMLVNGSVVHHIGGASSPKTPEIVRLKARKMGQSRVYAARKHGVKYAFVSAVISAAIQLLNPALLFAPRKRNKQFSFLCGVCEAFNKTPAQ